MDGSQTAAASAAVQPSAPPQVLDDRAALLIHHIAKVRPLLKARAEIKATLAAADQSVTEAFNYATADLKLTRKFLQELIDAAGTSHRDLLEERKERDWAFAVLGLPIQTDLFGEGATDTERDGLFYRLQGYQDGFNGLPSKPPEGMHSMFLNDYQGGWGDGQSTHGQYLARGAAIAEAQGAPNTAPPVDGLNEDGDDEVEDESPEALNAKAAKLASDPEFMGDAAGKRKRAGDIQPKGQAAKKAGVH